MKGISKMVKVPINVHLPITPALFIAVGGGLLGIGLMAYTSGYGVKLSLPPEVIEAARSAV
jgi:hypothetical protein